MHTAISQFMPDVVIHLAGQSSVGQSAGDAARTWAVNLCGSLMLAKSMAEIVPDCAMLFASSVEVYGRTFNNETVTEESLLRPVSPYACSKAAAEAMLSQVLPSTAKLMVARPCNHSGPGQNEAFVIPAFVAQLVCAEQGGSNVIRVGNLQAERDFLDVRDVVAAYIALLATPDLPARSIFNIASGQTVSIGGILDHLRTLAKVAVTIEQQERRMRPSEIKCASIDASALRHATGWMPTRSLGEMLEGIVEARRLTT